MILCNSFARLRHGSVELVVRLAHQHSQLSELGQQGIMVLGQIIHLITPMTSNWCLAPLAIVRGNVSIIVFGMITACNLQLVIARKVRSSPVLQLSPDNAALLLAALKTMLQVLYLHCITA